MYLLLLASGVIAGVTTLLFGFGGGFIVVPLVYAMLTAGALGEAMQADAMHVAVATSTCAMIFASLMGTLRHNRKGTIDWAQVRPLIIPICIGAAAGARVAMSLSGDWVRWVFVAYLGLTILDSLARPGFMARQGDGKAPLGPLAATLFGVPIGLVAAFLGVGGSVMTVPLMRRRGASMTGATAMASPLSLPMSIAGTAIYVLLAWNHASAASLGYAGYVDLRALLALTVGSWVGISLASRFVGRIPDRVHTRVYLFLLALVTLVMILV